jgi:lysophospholipase L1-like esterase
MKSRCLTIAAALLATLLPGTRASADVDPPVYYVSVGDSAAAGVQPPGWTALGYADQLALRMRQHAPRLHLVKLGCPGETTQTLISGTDSPCTYRSGSQLNEAASILRTHPGRIAFVTINVGVNDILDACLNGDTLALDPACVNGELAHVLGNLATIVRTLHDAAPGTPIAGMSYWNPFLGLWITGPDGEELARMSNEAMQALNAGLVSTYRSEGALVADVAGPGYFNIADFTTLVRSRWGTVPANVANACKWTWFCRRPPLGPDPHPTTRGYGVIADAFAAVLGVVEP